MRRCVLKNTILPPIIITKNNTPPHIIRHLFCVLWRTLTGCERKKYTKKIRPFIHNSLCE